MPELPEVETIARDLNKTVLLKSIKSVESNDPLVIKGVSPAQFIKHLKGAVIKQISRRGKAIIIKLDTGYFWVVQPMMTGQLVYAYPNEKANLLKETRLVVHLSDGGTLLYNDQRRFGHLSIVNDLNLINYFRIIGPEPFDEAFNEAYIKKALAKTTRPIKNILLDHVFVAGIGNIYASEILFRSRISPMRQGCKVLPKELPVLLKYIKEVLNEAIANRGSSMRNYRDGRGKKGQFNKLIRVYARTAQPCINCQHPIERVVQSGRSTFYCALCQN